jgi:hypothetical protein
MTPQESQLVEDLFDRLAKLETLPRDLAAERLIADGTQHAPHALYALVQTALVQDEALKRANARIEELQAQLNTPQAQPDERQSSFLDSVREAFGGHSQQPAQQQRGSVPSVRAGAASQGSYQTQATPPNYDTQPGQGAQPGYAPQMPPAGYGAPPFGGGSFLGAAASTATGMIGGALLLDGIRSMFGHHSGSGQSTFGALPEGRSSPSDTKNLWDTKNPWDTKNSDAGNSPNTSGSAADSDLARQAGIDHIGDAARNDGNATDTTGDNAGNNDDASTGNEDDWNNADDSDYTDDNNSDFGDANGDSGGSYDV